MSRVTSKIPYLLTIASMALLTGCAGYRLGSMLPPDVKSVCIPTFINRTTEPLIQMRATDATIAAIQKDGSLTVVDREVADSILKVTLTDYKLEPVGFEKNDSDTANQYRAVLTASIVLTKRRTGEVIAEAPAVQGQKVFIFNGDLSSSKLRALPEVCDDLANRIVEKVTEMW